MAIEPKAASSLSPEGGESLYMGAQSQPKGTVAPYAPREGQAHSALSIWRLCVKGPFSMWRGFVEQKPNFIHDGAL